MKVNQTQSVRVITNQEITISLSERLQFQEFIEDISCTYNGLLDLPLLTIDNIICFIAKEASKHGTHYSEDFGWIVNSKDTGGKWTTTGEPPDAIFTIIQTDWEVDIL